METDERVELVYGFIRGFWREHKYSPSMRDILEGLRLGSTDTVRRDLMMLREQGRIDFQEGIARTITLRDVELVFLDDVDDVLAGLDEVIV